MKGEISWPQLSKSAFRNINKFSSFEISWLYFLNSFIFLIEFEHLFQEFYEKCTYKQVLGLLFFFFSICCVGCDLFENISSWKVTILENVTTNNLKKKCSFLGLNFSKNWKAHLLTFWIITLQITLIFLFFCFLCFRSVIMNHVMRFSYRLFYYYFYLHWRLR